MLKKEVLSRNLCIFARERRAKLLMLGKMSKLFCPRLTAALSARNNKTTTIMATTTAKRRSAQPITRVWNLAKDLNYSEKLELVTMLIDSVKPKKADDMTMEEMLEGYPYKRYTKAELNAMLDEAEADIAAGKVIDDDDLRREDEEEYERELAEEQKLQLEAV